MKPHAKPRSRAILALMTLAGMDEKKPNPAIETPSADRARPLFMALEGVVMAAIPGPRSEALVTQAELARRLDVPKLVVGAIVKVLEQDGRVQRYPSFREDDGLICGTGYQRVSDGPLIGSVPGADAGAAEVWEDKWGKETGGAWWSKGSKT